MLKRIVSATMAAVVLLTSVGASAATGRIKTTVPANWWYGGSPQEPGSNKACAASGPSVDTVIGRAEACVKANIVKNLGPAGSPTFPQEGAILMNGVSGRTKEFTVQLKGNKGGHQVLMYFWGNCGAEPNATMNPGGTACTSKESVNACIERQDQPNRVVLNKAKKDCLAAEVAKVADYKSLFIKWKANGAAAILGVAAYMKKFPGAGFLAGAWSVNAGYSWNDWVDKCEAFAIADAHTKEQACEAPYTTNYRSLNSAIVKACQSS